MSREPSETEPVAEVPSSTTIPAAALLVGCAGVVPFAATAVQIATGWPLGPRMTGPALYILSIYGAAILSFLGGAHWGLAVAAHAERRRGDSWRRYVASIVPTLVAVGALWLGARPGLLFLALGFGGLLAYDLWAIGRDEAPVWYGRLRVGLTAAVMVCLLAAAGLGPF